LNWDRNDEDFLLDPEDKPENTTNTTRAERADGPLSAAQRWAFIVKGKEMGQTKLSCAAVDTVE